MEYFNRNMLKTLLFISLFTITGCAHKNMGLERDTERQVESEVSQAFKDLAVAAKSLNVDDYLAFFDKKQFTSLNDDGSVFHSFRDFEDLYRQQIPALEKYKSLNFANVKITVLNHSTAILVNEFTAEVVLKSGDTVSAGGAGTQVWSKTSGAWLLANVSASMKTDG